MKLIKFFLLTIFALALLGCASAQEKESEAQEKESKAQEEIHKERLELTEKYQECMEDAEGDKAKAESCEQYLKAAEALK